MISLCYCDLIPKIEEYTEGSMCGVKHSDQIEAINIRNYNIADLKFQLFVRFISLQSDCIKVQMTV